MLCPNGRLEDRDKSHFGAGSGGYFKRTTTYRPRHRRSAASSRRPFRQLQLEPAEFPHRIVERLAKAGYRLVAVVPDDAHAPELRSRGIEVHPIAMERSTLNPFSNLQLLGRYASALRKLSRQLSVGLRSSPTSTARSRADGEGAGHQQCDGPRHGLPVEQAHVEGRQRPLPLRIQAFAQGVLPQSGRPE